MFTVGEFDEIIPSIVYQMAAKVKNSRIEVFEGSRHLTTWVAREQNIEVVNDFLNYVDKK
jgi:pimeloyl-ACP methyl ester carboxylesterase